VRSSALHSVGAPQARRYSVLVRDSLLAPRSAGFPSRLRLLVLVLVLVRESLLAPRPAGFLSRLRLAGTDSAPSGCPKGFSHHPPAPLCKRARSRRSAGLHPTRRLGIVRRDAGASPPRPVVRISGRTDRRTDVPDCETSPASGPPTSRPAAPSQPKLLDRPEFAVRSTRFASEVLMPIRIGLAYGTPLPLGGEGRVRGSRWAF
jgi:hypothetical protein